MPTRVLKGNLREWLRDTAYLEERTLDITQWKQERLLKLQRKLYVHYPSYLAIVYCTYDDSKLFSFDVSNREMIDGWVEDRNWGFVIL